MGAKTLHVSTMIVGWGWTFPEILNAWCRAESLGFDAAYMGDDSFPHSFVESDYELSCYDPWTVLPAIAQATSKIRIGTTVTPAGRRHPGLFAKMTSIVDEISGGRLIVGMGAGNAPAQQNSFGEPFRSGHERVKMLSEELAILHSLWSEDRTSFVGEYYQVEEGINFPKPVQQPGPEILLGFKSTKYMPALVAKYAKRANMFAGDAKTAVGIRDAVFTECEKVGRDPLDVVISRCASIILHEDGSLDRDAILEQRADILGLPAETLKMEHDNVLSYVGPAKDCADFLRSETVDLGIDEIVVLIDTIDKNNHERTVGGMTVFADAVIPSLKQ